MVKKESKTGATADKQADRQSAAGSQVYLVWGEAQGPQGSIVGIHRLQEAS